MKIRLMLGDCLEVLKTLPDSSVGAVVTDPPFSEVTHAGARTRTEGANSDDLIDFQSMSSDDFIAFSREAVRVSARWVVMFCDWRHAALLEPAGLPLVRLGVWVKPNSAPQLTGDRPATGWEAIAFLHRPGKKRWNGGGRRGVWTCNRVDAINHPTEKPIPLVEELVGLFTDQGDAVLDPFMGSGTTGVACMNLGRSFIGCERDPVHFATACRRIGAAKEGRKAVAVSDAPDPMAAYFS